jgi:hypothetical protein
MAHSSSILTTLGLYVTIANLSHMYFMRNGVSAANKQDNISNKNGRN